MANKDYKKDKKNKRTTGKKPKTTSPTSKTKALRYSPGSY